MTTKPRPAFLQSDLTRAVKGAIAGGLPVVRTEISSDGTIRLWHTETSTESDPLAEWKAARENRAARRSQGQT